MPTCKLTKTVVDSLTYQADKPNGVCIYWDSKQDGFGCRVYPSGKKSFVVGFRVGGKFQRHTIGAYGEWTLDQARQRARELRVEAQRSGVDPVQEQRRKAEEQRKQEEALTFAQLCELYMSEYSKKRKRSWKEDQRRINKVLLPRWGKRKAQDVTRSDVSKLHREYGEIGTYEANRLLNLVSIIYRHAADADLLPEDKANPAAGIRKFKETARRRWLENDAELLAFLDSVEAEENVYYRTFFKVMLLTGFRKSELRTLKWSDVDLERGIARLETTKSGEAQTRQLSPAACALLDELPRQHKNPYCFPGKKPGDPLYDLKNPWNRIVERAGLEDFHQHDLRRSFVSILANSGTPLLIASRLAGHSSVAVTESVYSIIGVEPLQEAAALVSDKVMSIGEVKRKAQEAS